jgi:predicted amidohydrolase
MQQLRITTVQTSLIWGQPKENMARLGELLDKHTETSDVIVLPEMFTTGFSMDTNRNAEIIGGSAMLWMAAKAQQFDALIVGSVMYNDNNKHYNRLLVAYPDGTFLHYNKKHLFGLAEEPLHYTAGDTPLQFSFKGWEIKPLICYDLRFPVWSRNKPSKPYDVLIYVANWPAKRIYAWRQLLIARAIENQVYTIGCNIIGTDGNGIDYNGNSMGIDAMGDVMFELKNEFILKTVVLSKDTLDATRRSLPFLDDADEFSM